jgi:hypothetical protein|tara:strand:- start:707 stop:1423 length:717 start_codon:yes stop_codon:yes gene_type:complete
MSTLTVDTVTSSTADSDLSLDGNGTGVVDLGAGYKVGGTVDPLSGVAPGTNGNLLTSNGSAWTSAAAAAGGAWAVLSSGTFSAASNLNITGLTKTTQIWLTDVVGSGGAVVRALTSSDGGSSYDNGASDYAYVYQYFTSGGANAVASSTGAAFAYIAGGGIASATTSDLGLCFTIYNPADTAKHTYMIAQESSSGGGVGNVQRSDMGAVRKSAGLVNAVRIYPSAGTFTGAYVVIELN